MVSVNNLILKGAEELGISLTENQADRLTAYNDILIERNKVVNLTRITEPEEVVTKHFLDSLTPILTNHVQGKVIDVGTGAGFPGLVLKCAKPEIELTLLDSLNKRITFLKDAAAAMNITDGISFVHSRAEDAALSQEHREKYDTVVSRAVANMRTLAEWCLPFVKPGGYLLALKGPLAMSELDEARAAIDILGGGDIEVFSCDIPFTELNHRIIVIKKLRHTPKQFPRKGKKATEIPIEKIYKKR